MFILNEGRISNWWKRKRDEADRKMDSWKKDKPIVQVDQIDEIDSLKEYIKRLEEFVDEILPIAKETDGEILIYYIDEIWIPKKKFNLTNKKDIVKAIYLYTTIWSKSDFILDVKYKNDPSDIESKYPSKYNPTMNKESYGNYLTLTLDFKRKIENTVNFKEKQEVWSRCANILNNIYGKVSEYNTCPRETNDYSHTLMWEDLESTLDTHEALVKVVEFFEKTERDLAVVIPDGAGNITGGFLYKGNYYEVDWDHETSNFVLSTPEFY